MTVRGAVKNHIGDSDWTSEEKLEIRGRWLNTDMPKYLGAMENALEASMSGWLVGESVTIADILLYTQLTWIGGGILDGIPTSVLDDYPYCVALMEKVKSIDKIKEWMEKYPKPYGTFDFKP
jgi:glutathione S-transferase